MLVFTLKQTEEGKGRRGDGTAFIRKLSSDGRIFNLLFTSAFSCQDELD